MRTVLLSLVLLVSSVSASSEPLADRQLLVDMARRGDFAALDASLIEIQEAYEAGLTDEVAVHFAFSIFVNSDPALAERLDEWVDVRPDSYAAHLARAYHYESAAWNARGRRFARKTPPERLRRMRTYLERAEISARRAVELNPRLSVGYAKLLGIVRMNGGRDQARQVLEDGLRIDPASLEIRRAHAWMLLPQWGGTPEQREAFLDRIEDDAESIPALRPLLGYADYFASFSLPDEQQLDHLTSAVERSSQWYFFFLQRGRVLYRLRRYEEAIADFDRALAQRPHVVGILEDRADAHERLGNTAAALADVNTALDIDPFHPTVLADRANLYRSLDRYDDARADLDRALIYGGQDSYVRAERGRLFLYDDIDYATAASEWRMATELKPDWAPYWYHYANALYYRLDCDIVPVLDRYHALCEADTEQNCSEERMTWAVEAPASLIAAGDCPQRCSRLSRLLSLCG